MCVCCGVLWCVCVCACVRTYVCVGGGTCCSMSTETMRLIRDGEKGVGVAKGVWRWGKREIIYLLLHCHHQNDFCIKVGSDESHFNVS